MFLWPFSRRRVASNPPSAAPPAADPWFSSHYDNVAQIVIQLARPELLERGRKVLDFGCGDGAATLGIADRVMAEVFGVDLHASYAHLEKMMSANLGRQGIPANLHFRQTKAADPLPYEDSTFDLVSSWSVFEHVGDPGRALAEIARVLKKGGQLFLQIDPLFYSAFGSHLERLVPEPWAHLSYSPEVFEAMAASAKDEVPEGEKDTLYRTNAFENVKRYLLSEYGTLNRIRAEELVALVAERGFSITEVRRFEVEGHTPSDALLARYPRSDLMTNQIVILADRA